jgi:hypothetical protein
MPIEDPSARTYITVQGKAGHELAHVGVFYRTSVSYGRHSTHVYVRGYLIRRRATPTVLFALFVAQVLFENMRTRVHSVYLSRKTKRKRHLTAFRLCSNPNFGLHC